MYTVYKILNLITNEYYIGVHKTSNPNDSYMGSGILIRKAIKDFGLENFQKEILFSYEEKKDAYDKEKELLVNLLNDNLCLNLSEGGVGGSNFAGKKHSEETKKKISLALKGKLKGPMSQSMKENLSIKNKGKKLSEETKEKIRQSKMFLSEEAKKNISQARIGKKHSEETKKKLSIAAKKREERKRNFMPPEPASDSDRLISDS